MKTKFTFKTKKSTGRGSPFYPDHHYIEIKGRECGSIDDKSPHRIRFMVEKKDINEDGNPNCKWKWIMLTKKSTSLSEAKEFLNSAFDIILAKYNLHFIDS